jgi:hypothetical protein
MKNDDDFTSTMEAFGVPDTFCEGIARIDQIGGVRRLIFFVRDTMDPTRTRVVAAKLIMPAETLADVAQMLAADRPVHGALATLSHMTRAN